MKEKQIKTERGGGAFLFIIAPGLFLFYIFTPQWSFQFISLFFIILILGSRVYSEYLSRHLNLVRRDRELRVFRHEWTGVELWAENSGFLPAFLMVVGDTSGGVAVFRNIKSLCTLGAKSRQLFRWEAYGNSRGVFTMGPGTIRGSDPLGLFPFVLNFEETTKLYVYPAPAYVGLKSPGGIPLGNLISTDPFNEDLTRSRSLREYKNGDESKRINWKASARNSMLLVNEYELSLSYPLVLFLNVDPDEYVPKNREHYIERIIETASAICLMAARDRQVLGLILHTGDRDQTEDSLISPAAFTMIPILERLAALQPFKASGGKGPDGDGDNPGDSGDLSGEDSVEPSREYLRASTRLLLEKGKTLNFGTRLIYAGPSLPEEDFFAMETLKRQRLSIEYFIIDEKNLAFPGGTGKYQLKEMGYAIL